MYLNFLTEFAEVSDRRTGLASIQMVFTNKEIWTIKKRML